MVFWVRNFLLRTTRAYFYSSFSKVSDIVFHSKKVIFYYTFFYSFHKNFGHWLFCNVVLIGIANSNRSASKLNSCFFQNRFWRIWNFLTDTDRKISKSFVKLLGEWYENLVLSQFSGCHHTTFPFEVLYIFLSWHVNLIWGKWQA